jgi:hypothetical protein
MQKEFEDTKEQTTQWPKEKAQKRLTKINKTYI